MSVVPATWEAEAGESLEPGRQRLQWAEIMLLHSSAGDSARLHLKTTTTTTTRTSNPQHRLMRSALLKEENFISEIAFNLLYIYINY